LAGHRTLQSPVLVGRDDFLTLAGRRLAAAAGGRGHLLFVAGEAGIGKTRLLAAIAAEAAGRSFATVRAAAFPGDTETSGGLLLDLASDLRQSREAGLAEAGEAMAGRLRELAGVGGRPAPAAAAAGPGPDRCRRGHWRGPGRAGGP